MDASPRWSTNTKLIVMLAVLVVIGFFLVRFQVLIIPLIMALILAYLLNPLVIFLTKHLRVSRSVAVLLLYGVLILLLIGLAGGAGYLLQQQLSGVLATVRRFIDSIPVWIDTLSAEPILLGPFTFDLSTADITLLQDALLSAARDGVGQITELLTGAATDVVSFVGWTVFAFMVAFYLLHDMDALQLSLVRIVPENHKKDVGRLLSELGPIWNAFLRGQMLLSLIMGLAIGAAMGLLGVRYALVLGLMAALAEFIPIIGANVVGATAIVIALFQPVNWLGLSPVTFAIVVGLTGGVLQQLESNFLIPRVMGDQLKLHPAIMIIGALVGFSLLGLPGLLLSGPIIATARLFGKYVHAKLFNLPPWPAQEGARSTGAQLRPVRIRPARESDKKDMLELTEKIWEGHDYTPQVWSEWQTDRNGLLAAAELDKRMVGFGKLSFVGPGEWWLEGLRVHPGFQGMKIGSQLTEHLVEVWRKRGGGVIRLATSSERVEVHRVCGRLGFRRVGVFRVTAAKPLTRGACEYRAATGAELPDAIAFWKEHGAAWKTPDLVNDGWQWSRFSEAWLAEVVRRGGAWWWRNRSGILLTYDSNHDNKPSLEVSAFIAPAGTLSPMLRQLRVLAHTKKAERAAWVAPDFPRITHAAQRAGFTSAWDSRLWLFERTE
jgi:predicted PurR-regulated permease PerM/ribosomal protein S18 acetylase RimI-like enzyme